MAEQLYEGMFLVDSGRYASDPEGVTGELIGLLEKVGATVVAHRPWQDGKLAYPIEGLRKGVHYLTYFKMPAAQMTDFTRACQLSDLVVRQLVIKHTPTLFEAMVAAISTTPAEDVEESEETAEAKSADAVS